MIIKIKNYEECEEDNNLKIGELIKKFNEKALEIKSKYFLEQFEPNNATLVKYIFPKFKLGNFLGENIIYYKKEDNEFYFENGIDQSIYNEIEEILENIEIESEFLVEVIL